MIIERATMETVMDANDTTLERYEISGASIRNQLEASRLVLRGQVGHVLAFVAQNRRRDADHQLTILLSLIDNEFKTIMQELHLQ
jgi:hypothetical protein